MALCNSYNSYPDNYEPNYPDNYKFDDPVAWFEVKFKFRLGGYHRLQVAHVFVLDEINWCITWALKTQREAGEPDVRRPKLLYCLDPHDPEDGRSIVSYYKLESPRLVREAWHGPQQPFILRLWKHPPECTHKRLKRAWYDEDARRSMNAYAQTYLRDHGRAVLNDLIHKIVEEEENEKEEKKVTSRIEAEHNEIARTEGEMVEGGEA